MLPADLPALAGRVAALRNGLGLGLGLRRRGQLDWRAVHVARTGQSGGAGLGRVVRRLVRAVHGVLEQLERLGKRGVHTVAAVGGPVPGGALELSLACRTIVAADDPSTRIGLPETKLGIVPGWGGCHRLPRRIGLPAALTAILTGRLYDVRRAMKMGIIDRKTPAKYLERIARDLAMGREASPKRRRPVLRWLVDRNDCARTDDGPQPCARDDHHNCSFSLCW